MCLSEPPPNILFFTTSIQKERQLNMTDRLCSEPRQRNASRTPSIRRQLPIEHTNQTQPDSQVSYIDISPSCVDPSRPPVIFAGGIFLRSEHYITFLQALANRYHAHVFAVTLPSMGESHLQGNASIHAEDLVDAVTTVIRHEITQGGFHLMGHSLGSIPMRYLYLHPEALEGSGRNRRHLERTILIAPVPTSEEQTLLDVSIPTRASWEFALGNLGRNAAQPLHLGQLAFNHHSPASQNELIRSIGEERFATNPWAAISIFATNDNNATLSHLEHEQDPGLRYVIPEEDHLFRQTLCQSARGYQCLPHADHAFMALTLHEQARGAHVNAVYESLVGGWEGEEFSTNRAYRSRSWTPTESAVSLLRIGPNGDVNLGIGLRFGVERTLGALPPFALTSRAMIYGSGFIDLHGDTSINLEGILELGMPITPIPVFNTEIGIELSAGVNTGQQTPYSLNGCGYARFQFQRMFQFGGRACYPLINSTISSAFPLTWELFSGIPF